MTRYVIVCHPQLKQRLTSGVCNVIGASCLLHGLVWAVVPLTGVGSTGYVYEPSGLSCTPDWEPDNVGYISGLFVAAFVLPVILSTFSFVCIQRQVCCVLQITPLIKCIYDINVIFCFYIHHVYQTAN